MFQITPNYKRCISSHIRVNFSLSLGALFKEFKYVFRFYFDDSSNTSLTNRINNYSDDINLHPVTNVILYRAVLL